MTAYEVLKDEDTRHEYDYFLKHPGLYIIAVIYIWVLITVLYFDKWLQRYLGCAHLWKMYS